LVDEFAASSLIVFGKFISAPPPNLPLPALAATVSAMSATEVIEEIKQLPPVEQRKVAAYVRELEAPDEVSDNFKRIADEVFTTNAELFRKLAQ
jgi:hypothetical protein